MLITINNYSDSQYLSHKKKFEKTFAKMVFSRLFIVALHHYPVVVPSVRCFWTRVFDKISLTSNVLKQRSWKILFVKRLFSYRKPNISRATMYIQSNSSVHQQTSRTFSMNSYPYRCWVTNGWAYAMVRISLFYLRKSLDSFEASLLNRAVLENGQGQFFWFTSWSEGQIRFSSEISKDFSFYFWFSNTAYDQPR